MLACRPKAPEIHPSTNSTQAFWQMNEMLDIELDAFFVFLLLLILPRYLKVLPHFCAVCYNGWSGLCLQNWKSSQGKNLIHQNHILHKLPSLWYQISGDLVFNNHYMVLIWNLGLKDLTYTLQIYPKPKVLEIDHNLCFLLLFEEMIFPSVNEKFNYSNPNINANSNFNFFPFWGMDKLIKLQFFFLLTCNKN